MLDEPQLLLEFGKTLSRAIEELITIVSVSTFYRWYRDEKAAKKNRTESMSSVRMNCMVSASD